MCEGGAHHCVGDVWAGTSAEGKVGGYAWCKVVVLKLVDFKDQGFAVGHGPPAPLLELTSKCVVLNYQSFCWGPPEVPLDPNLRTTGVE